MFTKIHGGVSHRTLGFYGNDPVCLFKFFVSSDEPQSAYSWSLLVTNFLCFGVISISYLVVFAITSTSSLSQSQGATGDMVRSRNNRLQRKISIIILTDFLCWVPFVIICFLHTIGQIDASPWYSLLSILILPVNSVINPLLYNDTVERIVGRVFCWIRREINVREIAQRLTILRVHRETNNQTDAAREPGHTSLSIPPDVAREPDTHHLYYLMLLKNKGALHLYYVMLLGNQEAHLHYLMLLGNQDRHHLHYLTLLENQDTHHLYYLMLLENQDTHHLYHLMSLKNQDTHHLY